MESSLSPDYKWNHSDFVRDDLYFNIEDRIRVQTDETWFTEGSHSRLCVMRSVSSTFIISRSVNPLFKSLI